MGYCTVADVKARYDDDELRRLTDDAKTGAIDDNVIQSEIDNATTEINGYLQNRYVVPVVDDPFPELLKVWCLEFTAYNIVKRRKGLTGDMPETLTKERERIIGELRKVNEGRLSIAATLISDLPLSSPNRVMVVRTRPGKVFTNETLDKFRGS